MNILVYVELDDGVPTAHSLELIAGARRLAGAGGQVSAAAFGADPARAADLGADRVFVLTGSTAYNPVEHGAALDAIVGQGGIDLVLLGCTTPGLDLGPILAFRKDWPLVSYCTAIRAGAGAVEVDSQIYGGKLVSTATAALPAVLLVNAGAFEEGPAGSGGSVETVSLPKQDGAALSLLSVNRPDPNAVDITKSNRLVCVGRGIGEQDAIEEVREIAGLIGGEVVGSRPVVDAGWLPKERQVGKSGRKVKPQLYLALGVSGAPEHIEGMGSAGTIVAINTDPAAPIFDHAHIGATVDVADFLPAFRDALSRKVA